MHTTAKFCVFHKKQQGAIQRNGQTKWSCTKISPTLTERQTKIYRRKSQNAALKIFTCIYSILELRRANKNRDEIENYRHGAEQHACSKRTRQNHSVIHSTDVDVKTKTTVILSHKNAHCLNRSWHCIRRHGIMCEKNKKNKQPTGHKARLSTQVYKHFERWPRKPVNWAGLT